jgi:hypothetical protein
MTEVRKKEGLTVAEGESGAGNLAMVEDSRNLT